MARIKLIFIQYKWYFFLSLGLLFFCVTYFLFSNDRKKMDSMKDTMLNLAIDKKTQVIEQMISVKKESVKAKEEEIKEIQEKIETIREEKNSIPSEIKLLKLRELSDAFKKINLN